MDYKRLLVICTVGIVFFSFVAWYWRMHMSVSPSRTKGTVIILNGPSAAGKTSIQRSFQSLMMPRLWIKLGIDSLFDGPLPDITLENLAYWQSQNSIRWVENTTDIQGNPVITLYVGAAAENVVFGMNSAIAAYAQQGCNVIVDYIAYKKEWLIDLQTKLAGLKTVWVKVAIPLDVLEQREAARKTSPKGHARSHYDFVYHDFAYDITVDSALQSSQEMAETIKAFID
jgi:chloramphenicol 3-O phosphotransferase